MNLNIPKDYFDGTPTPPRVFLCNTSKRIIGELPATNRNLNAKWGTSYSEFSFEIPRTYVDMIDGETKVHPLYDKVEIPRNILVENTAYFSLQDINKTSDDNDIKSVTCFDYAYATLGNKYVNNFRVNTGEIDSIEVMYNEKVHGYDYVIDQDSMYILASTYDSFENYYIKEYVDKSHVWEQVQIANKDDYDTYFGDGANSRTPLYVRNYPNVRFYWESKPELSLISLVLANAPEWKIGHVDAALWRKERKLDIDRSDIYSLLTNDIADIFKTVVIFDSVAGTVNFYEEIDDGLTEDGSVDDLWDTDVFISKYNLANSIEVKYSADNIRTKLKLSSGDGVNVREVNLGSDYIMNLDFYHNEEWMEQDLFEAYDDYLEAVKTYTPLYESEMKNWVATNNRYHEVVNAVPAENDVVMIGDTFEKLYCMFGAINTAFATPDIMNNISTAENIVTLYYDEACTEVIDKTKLSNGDVFVVGGYKYIYDGSQYFVQTEDLATTTLMSALVEKLKIYRVDEDINGTVQDNILLTLKNHNSATATIRIYAPKVEINTSTVPYDDNQKYYTRSGNTESTYKYTYVAIKNDDIYKNYEKLYINNYQISCIVVDSNGITTTPFYGTLTQWLRGELTAHKMGLVNTEDSGATIPNFTVKYIGTMGAYLVISKNEYVYTNDEWVPSEDYLRTYGVNLLKEKADIYLKIFQTQTGGMYQNDGYQCIAQDAEPHGGNVTEGTRWFKTNAQPPTLYKRNAVASTVWTERWDEFVEEENEANMLNYQRYMDNYQKMTVTSKVLQEQEMKAEYLLNGYAVSSNPIYYGEYIKDTDGNYRRNGQLLEGDMHRAALAHFCGTQAYYPQTIDGSSQWNELDVLYLNTYKDANNVTQYINQIDKSSLPNGARYHVNGYSYQYNDTIEKFQRRYNGAFITRVAMDQELPLYTFTNAEDTFSKSDGVFDANETYYIQQEDGRYDIEQIAGESVYETYDGTTREKTLYVRNIYAVYLQGNIPYVAYASSQGVHQMKKDYYANQVSMESFFNDDQKIRLAPFIREDEYTNDDIITTDYDSEEEKNKIFKEFVEEAAKELKMLSQPSLEFSMTMANLLALPEFEPLYDQFQLGKFIRVGINDDYSKRARLLEVNINFDDLSDFNCVFGDLKTAKSQVDLHAELLSQAVRAGTTVAKGEAGWQSAVDKSNKLEESIANGLRDAALSVASSSGQNITWDQRGIVGRKLIDGTTDQYEDEQFMLTNNKLVFTGDAWNTSKSCFGKFTVDGVERWGVLSDAVIAGYIESPTIVGGSLKVGGTGGTFYVHENGSVEILGPDASTPVYATKDSVDLINQATQYHTSLEYTGTTIFTEPGQACTITCRVFDYNTDITDKLPTGTVFRWIRSSNASDTEWNATHTYTDINTITITNEDIEKNAQFHCQCTFDETQLA